MLLDEMSEWKWVVKIAIFSFLLVINFSFLLLIKTEITLIYSWAK